MDNKKSKLRILPQLWMNIFEEFVSLKLKIAFKRRSLSFRLMAMSIFKIFVKFLSRHQKQFSLKSIAGTSYHTVAKHANGQQNVKI